MSRWVSYQSYIYRYGLVFMCFTALTGMFMGEGCKESWQWMNDQYDRRQLGGKRLE